MAASLCSSIFRSRRSGTKAASNVAASNIFSRNMKVFRDAGPEGTSPVAPPRPADSGEVQTLASIIVDNTMGRLIAS
ncbi:hypothetical protein WJX84_003807 [Apatococcus fuscideae]|uniref:Uncharacterized protein n=1 Tax=Apatococcus fuscideae TaxID=2026836 RepID=A0AAW1T997_9CHLO